MDGAGPLYRLNSKENRIKEYTWLQKSGVVGVKIDFFPDDYSSNMDYYIDLLEDAAKYKLMVNFMELLFLVDGKGLILI